MWDRKLNLYRPYLFYLSLSVQIENDPLATESISMILPENILILCSENTNMPFKMIMKAISIFSFGHKKRGRLFEVVLKSENMVVSQSMRIKRINLAF